MSSAAPTAFGILFLHCFFLSYLKMQCSAARYIDTHCTMHGITDVLDLILNTITRLEFFLFPLPVIFIQTITANISLSVHM